MRNKFLLGFIGSFTLPVLIILGLNYYTINYYKSDINLYNINGVPNENFYENSNLDIIFQKLYKGDHVANTIIGTSHLMYGVNDCNNNIFQRIALPGLTFEEGKYFLNKVIKNSTITKTVFFEISSSKKNNLRKDLKRGLRIENSFVSPYLTAAAVKKTYQKLFPVKKEMQIDSSKTICEQIEFSLKKHKIAREEKNQKEINNLKKGVKNESIRPISNEEAININSSFLVLENKTALKHNIVLFFSPIHEIVFTSDYNYKTHLNNAAVIREIVNDLNIKNKNFNFQFIDGNSLMLLDKSSLSNFDSYWYDLTHYKPILGEQFLQLLGVD